MNSTATASAAGLPGPDDREPARRVAAAVAAHPEVARMDGGPFGTIATLLPGAKVVGVRIGLPQEPVEIAVALRYRPDAPPMYRTAEELLEIARSALGSDLGPDRKVTVAVTDVVPDGDVIPDTRSGPDTEDDSNMQDEPDMEDGSDA